MSDNVVQEIRKHAGLFLSVAFIAAAVFAVPFSGTLARHDVPLRVVVIARDSAAAPARDIAANLVSFSETEEYRKLFRFRTEAKYGNEASVTRVSVGLEPEGSVLSVSVRAGTPERSEALAREATHALFLFASRYYNVKTEADFRIIGTAPSDGVVNRISAYAFSASAAGLVTALLLFLAASFFRTVARSVPRAGKGVPVLDTGFFRPERPSVPILDEEMSEEIPVSEEGSTVSGDADSIPDIVMTEEKETEEPDVPATVDKTMPSPEAVMEEATIPVVPAERKGAAPTNLPGMTDAESRFLEEFSFEPGEETDTDPEDDAGMTEDILEAEEEPEDTAPVSAEPAETPAAERREPTQEEYRRRLNELLGR